MNTTTRLTGAAALATVLGALGLLPVIAGMGWLAQALLVLLVVAASGEGARRLGTPRLLVPVVQLGALAVALTALSASGVAVYGVLPGPGAVRSMAALLTEGLRESDRFATPVPPTPAIRFIAVGGLGLVGLAVDLLAVTYRRAALAGLPLLALYTVPASVLPAGVSWPFFVLAAAGLITVLLADGRDRLTAWGRPLGSAGLMGRGPRSSAVLPVETPSPTQVGRRIGAAVLGVAVVVPALLPGLSDGVINSHGTGSGPGGGGRSIATVNPIVSLRRDLNRPDNVPIMRVRSGSAQPGYLRTVTLDSFDGTEWRTVARQVRPLDGAVPVPAGLADPVARTEVRTEVHVSDRLASQWLPLPYPTTRLDVDGDWRYDPDTGNVISADSGRTTAGLSYVATSLDVEPTPAQLGSAPGAGAEQAKYLQLPSLPPSVLETARRVTRDARTPYARALALQAWFRNPDVFSYDITTREGNGASAIESFLRDRSGYCEQFASAMAVMARQLGIPSRVDVGFTAGDRQDDGSYLVHAHDAHAWPELYFVGAGWVRFEPTPIGDGRGQTPSWATTSALQLGGGSAGTAPLGATQPGQLQRAQPDCNVGGARLRTAADRQLCAKDKGGQVAVPTQPREVSPQRAAGNNRPAPVLPVALAAAGLLLALAPAALRLAIRRRRWASATDAGSRVWAAWAELRDSARDLGYPWSEAETSRQVTSRLATEARMSPHSLQALQRVATASERVRYARAHGEVGDLSGDVRTVVAALAARRSRAARWRALLLPISTGAAFGRVAERVADGLDGLDRLLARLRGKATPRRSAVRTNG